MLNMFVVGLDKKNYHYKVIIEVPNELKPKSGKGITVKALCKVLRSKLDQ